jgi:hypothetical protein
VKLHEADADMENSVIEAKQCNGAKWEQLCADADDNGRRLAAIARCGERPTVKLGRGWLGVEAAVGRGLGTGELD